MIVKEQRVKSIPFKTPEKRASVMTLPIEERDVKEDVDYYWRQQYGSSHATQQMSRSDSPFQGGSNLRGSTSKSPPIRILLQEITEYMVASSVRQRQIRAMRSGLASVLKFQIGEVIYD
jgi:hypothetical protein